VANFDPSQRVISYDKKELRQIAAVIRKMEEEAKNQAKGISDALVRYAVEQIKIAAQSHPRPKQATKIANGVRISKTSVLGEFGLGFASQKFSGGATTQLNEGSSRGQKGILAGVEFGARKQKQFLPRTPKFGLRGNEGTFIWPTMRKIQPYILQQWENSFSTILKEWDK
jgi:hypothetical protein